MEPREDNIRRFFPNLGQCEELNWSEKLRSKRLFFEKEAIFYHLKYELGFCLYVLNYPLMAFYGSFNVNLYFSFRAMVGIVKSKDIIEKSRGGRFLWNRNWDLGWIWAGLATFEAVFFMFSWEKKVFKNILDGQNIFGIQWTE